jgi:hypothetical protein
MDISLIYECVNGFLNGQGIFMDEGGDL